MSLKFRSLENYILPILIIGVLFLVGLSWTQSGDVEKIGRVPVLNSGRLKPLDSFARESLLVIHGKQSVRIQKDRLSALNWFLTVAIEPEIADELPVFYLHNPQVKSFLGISDFKQKQLSFNQLFPSLPSIHQQVQVIEPIEAQVRTPFQRDLYNLYTRLYLYHQLKQVFFHEQLSDYSLSLKAFQESLHRLLPLIAEQKPISSYDFQDKEAFIVMNGILKLAAYQKTEEITKLFPHSKKESDPNAWFGTGQAIELSVSTHKLHPLLLDYAGLFDAMQVDPESLELSVATTPHLASVQDYFDNALTTRQRGGLRLESLHNHLQPFAKSMMLYILAILILFISYFMTKPIYLTLGMQCISLSFFLHTAGLLSRMIIQGRPPVTNLYSSAIFVGWVGVLLALLFAKRFDKRGIGIIASTLGFLSLIIAHHLSLQGDTLEMMQAVLDSNFWLSTHVTTITMGYSAVFLAGFIAIFYVLRALFFSNSLTKEVQKEFSKLIYVMICVGLILSFIGTVLGGIWADQSWGRFWGWDPKENGALMIVLWTVIVLHAKLTGKLSMRGLVSMAIVGNMITAFSWFGVNMLGIGLHSYGFMDKAFVWLAAFMISQLLVIALVWIKLPANPELK